MSGPVRTAAINEAGSRPRRRRPGLHSAGRPGRRQICCRRLRHVVDNAIPDGGKQAEVERGLGWKVVQQTTFGHPSSSGDGFQGDGTGAAPAQQVAKSEENALARTGRHS